MTPGTHCFHDLFSQLGLGSEDHQIRRFVRTHSPLPDDVRIADAPFWTSAQAGFLRQALQLDSDWVARVDHLDVALHGTVAN